MKRISDIWPSVILLAGATIPISFRKRFVKA